jgi:hypothetical protein
MGSSDLIAGYSEAKDVVNVSIKQKSSRYLDEFKQEAKDNGLSLAEQLWCYTREFVCTREFGNAGKAGDWRIAGVRRNVRTKLVSQARAMGYTLGSYFEYLAENVGKEGMAKVKLDKIRNILED